MAFLVFDFFDPNFDMVGTGCLAGTATEHIAKLDARLMAMLSGVNCHQNTMARLGELGVTTVAALTTLVDTRAELRVFLADGLGLDPKKEPKIEHSLEAGKVVMAWEQANKRTEVENKKEAERLSANLPPQLNPDDVILLRKQFEKNLNRGIPLSDAETPSKAYLELKVSHAETSWAPERLTEVTSWAQAERHRLGNAQEKTYGMDELTCSFKVITKPFGIPMPTDSETLRARLKLMGNTYLFLKLKFPQKGVLSTCTKEMWSDYTDFLFGDTVWGFCSRNEADRPVSCPHQGIVMSYDFALRKDMCRRMSEGTDIEAALTAARNDVNLRNFAFLAQFTTEIATPRCRALTAPAFRDIHGAGAASAGAKQPGAGDENKTKLTRSQKKAAQKQRAQQKKQLAITDGQTDGPPAKRQKQRQNQQQAQAILDRVNDPPSGAAGGAAAGSKAKGKGKNGLRIRTSPKPDGTGGGTPICFAYNNGTPCKTNPCNWAHVCQICEGGHPKGECPNRQR